MASARLRKALASAARRVPHVIADGLGFAGACAIAYGAWLIYAPAGFLVGGVLLMALSMLIGRKLERTTT
jgi:uncharacterized RDD family membrane protein YckC